MPTTHAQFSDQPHGLPPVGFGRFGGRWTASLKVTVVWAVGNGHLTAEQVEADYGISAEELAAWTRAYDDRGPGGLRAIKGLQRSKVRHKINQLTDPREIIPHYRHKGVSLPRLRFMSGSAQ